MSWDDSPSREWLCFVQASDLAELREARRELRKSRGSAGKRGMAEVGLDADWLKVVDVEFHYQWRGSDKKSGRIYETINAWFWICYENCWENSSQSK